MNMETFSYIINSAAWSLVGLVIGYAVGIEARAIERIKEAVVRDPEPKKELRVPRRQREKSPRQEKAAHDRNRAFGIFLLLLALLTIGTAVQQTVKQNCQAEFNSTSNKIQSLRGQWADEDRNALIEFFKVYQAKPTPSESARSEAFFKLIDTYNVNTERRKQHPLPDLKEECG